MRNQIIAKVKQKLAATSNVKEIEGIQNLLKEILKKTPGDFYLKDDAELAKRIRSLAEYLSDILDHLRERDFDSEHS